MPSYPVSVCLPASFPKTHARDQFAALGWVLGYRDGHCDFSNIGVPYDPENCKYYILRSISAVFGSMVGVARRQLSRASHC